MIYMLKIFALDVNLILEVSKCGLYLLCDIYDIVCAGIMTL